MRTTTFWLIVLFSLWLLAPWSYLDATETKVNEEPQRGGVLYASLSARPAHLNPAVQTGVITMTPGAQLFAHLLHIDRQWKFHPYLAERWKSSDDGLSVTFHLRHGAVFHDGKPITSEDVAFSIEAVKKHHPFSTMLKAVERVDTPDPHTAIVRLKQPHPALLIVTASPMLPILPKHVYGDGQDLLTHPANWKVVGSGPFRLVKTNSHQIVMTRHERHFMPGLPYLDQVVFKKISEQTVYPAFETGVLHMNGFQSDVEEVKELVKLPHLRSSRKGYQGIGPLQWIAFNLEKPPFNDFRVRQAIAYAIDRDFLVQNQFHNIAKAATGPISPNHPLYTNQVERYDLNVAKANRLLDEAGYPRDASGFRFSTPFTYSTNLSEVWRQTVEYLRTDLLNKIGVELRPNPIAEFKDFMHHISHRRFTLALDDVFNWADPVIGVHRTYDSHNIREGVMWSNTQGYRNAKVDTLMHKAGIETDPVKRKKLYHDFQKIVAHELPVYWLVELPSATVYHKDLRGINHSIWGTMVPFDRIYWKKPIADDDPPELKQ
ncbi:MAG: ABC transporter substrate-binding protein [Magnetococcales bacterium]|nr:ABC transporter substrate-binding protein [Magnetococcales bacterium]